MQDDKRLHHLTEMVQLHVEAHETPCASRPPLPVQQMYPMDMLEGRLHVKPPAKAQKAAKSGSLFAKGLGRDFGKDPFLNRLARLN